VITHIIKYIKGDKKKIDEKKREKMKKRFVVLLTNEFEGYIIELY